MIADDEESVSLRAELLPPVEQRLGLLLLSCGPEAFVMTPPELQSAGVKFLKINGERLLEELTPGGERPISAITRDISPEDVPALFVRYGIDLIAEKVENEKSVIEILEFEIPYGQGHVFGAPRPIKGSLQDETAPPPDFLRRVSPAAM